MKITLLYGGESAEHDVSIISAHNICQAIKYDYYKVQPIYITKDGIWLKGAELKAPSAFDEQLRLIQADTSAWGKSAEEPSTGIVMNPGSIDHENNIVFPVLHGPNGEDGTIQGFLEVLNVPYVGAGVTGSACGMDKIISKQLFDQVDLPQVPYVAFDLNEWTTQQADLVRKCEGSLLYPLFVKPANMGSSVGISQVENQAELIEAIELALNYDRRIVVEQGIDADECEVALLGNSDVSASVVGRLIKDREFYDYEEKYINNRVEMEIPAKIPDEVSEKIKNYAIKAYKAVDGRGLSRVDFFVTTNYDIYINEINTMPGFTQFSMYPSLWKETGLKYEDLIEELLQLALNQYQLKQSLHVAF